MYFNELYVVKYLFCLYLCKFIMFIVIIKGLLCIEYLKVNFDF